MLRPLRLVRYSKPLTLAVLWLALSGITATAQETESTNASLEDLTWLVGQWRGEGFGGECEEIWNPAEGGSMMGTFRLVQDGSVVFYEFMTITIEAGEPLLRLKHFNADLTGWEAKEEVITFETEYLKPNEIGFDGLTYRLTSRDSLTIVVHTEGDGETVLECHRVKTKE